MYNETKNNSLCKHNAHNNMLMACMRTSYIKVELYDTIGFSITQQHLRVSD